jgi:ribonucleotide reductase class II
VKEPSSTFQRRFARANADLLNTAERRLTFLKAYADDGGRRSYAENVLRSYAAADGLELTDKEFSHRMDRYGLNPCGEIIGRDFHCNLAEVHLNTIDPSDYKAQEAAFYAAGLQVAALLQHEFVHERYQYSREIDPIVGVSFTGLWDFMVHTGGYDWLRWMMEGRKEGRAQRMYEALERDYLRRWRRAANEGVKDYCRKAWPAETKSRHHGAASGH